MGRVMNAVPTLATLLEGFFTRRLMMQRKASPHTIASYRDTFRLLLRFAQQHQGKAPSDLALSDVDVPLVLAFLDDLEQGRGASERTRNLRLTAMSHGFLQFHEAFLQLLTFTGARLPVITTLRQ